MIEERDMEQCKADPYVFRKMVDAVAELVVVVHVDDILVGGSKESCDELLRILNTKFPTNNLGEIQWYMGCAVKRNWDRETIEITQTAFVETLLKRFDITTRAQTSASPVAELGSRRANDEVIDRPFMQAVGGIMWLAGMTRPDVANAMRAVARHAHDPCERHWKAVLQILVYLNVTRKLGITFRKEDELSLSVYADADYAKIETNRRSTSGVAVMLGGAAVYTTSRTQHCVTLSTTEAEYVAMAEGAKEGLFIRSVLIFMQPKERRMCLELYEIEIKEDNAGTKAMAENPLSSGRSKHIDVRWHFLRDLVDSWQVKIVHVSSEWQHADMLTKALSITLFKRHRTALMNMKDEA